MEPATIEIVVQAIVGLATVVITAIVAPLLLKQAKVADGKLSQQARDTLYPILLQAIAWGQATIQKDVQGQAASVQAIKDQVITQAIAFSRLHAAETLDELGVSDEALRRMLQSRLEQAIAWARSMFPNISDAQASVTAMPVAADVTRKPVQA